MHGLTPGAAARARWTANHLPQYAAGAIVAGPGQVLVGLFDSDRTTERIVAVPLGEATFRMVYDGAVYDRVAQALDGRVQYAPFAR